MAISGRKTHTSLDDIPGSFDKRVPRPEDIYPVPDTLLNCLIEIAPKIQQSGTWWAVSGDLSENVVGVHVNPTDIEIVTDGIGVAKIMAALSVYNLAPVAVIERTLEREADLDLKKYPVFERFTGTEFVWAGAKVSIQGDYQLKVGEWEWGDTFFFEPDLINIAGNHMPMMPLDLRSEIYITLGWLERANLISEAFTRARSHGHVKPPGSPS